ncbi:hypothetical protein OG879_33705 [Streptomyces caniferus]|uniref:Uncharacterized protein n=1 Tax=Streptomyces caniferus TaxID=285557 RepID=A0A640S6P8_9ACTN|nr:hypothetical protein [Streptomyces caniferus]GFE06474.1 hypothetical protein Scani_27420 [Streptomyces caniferus]
MAITPRLVAKYRIPGIRHALPDRGRFDRSGPIPRLLLKEPDALRVYELGEDIELLAEFPRPTPQGSSVNDWAAPDLSFAVFQDETSYTAVHRDGSRMWRQSFGAWTASRWGHVGFAMAGPYRETQVLLRLPSGTVGKSLFAALDTAGNVLACTMLPCGGQERDVGLTWESEGYLTGVYASGGGAAPTLYQASLVCGHIALGKQMTVAAGPPWQPNRVALSTNPSGTGEMSVDEGGQDVYWHRLPSLEVAAVLRLSDFPAAGTGDCSVHDRPWISCRGGYVDADTALVALHNSYNEARVLMFGEDIWEEHSHWLADPETGELHGRIAYPMRDVDCVWLLGDGTWVTAEWNTLYRWSAPDGAC